MHIKTILINTTIVLVSSLVGLAVAEVGLRLLDRPSWRGDVRAGWKSNDEYVNELGYRGKPISYSDSDIVVVLLGDSQVELIACPPDLMPEKDLERNLRRIDARFTVVTVGDQGFGTDQEYLALKEYYKKYRADIVVLWQTFDNDVWNNIFPTARLPEGVVKPTFWLEDGALKGPNYQFGEVIQKAASTKIGVIFNKLRDPERDLDKSWERHLPAPYRPLTQYAGSYATDWDPSNPDNDPFVQSERLQTEKSYYSVQLFPRSERMQYGLDLTKKLLGKIQDLTNERNGSLIVFYTLLPDEKRSLDKDEMDDIVVQKRDGLFYRSSLRQKMVNMAYVNDGFTTIAIQVLLENWRVSKFNAHLNCAANEQVMHDLAAKIAESVKH